MNVPPLGRSALFWLGADEDSPVEKPKAELSKKAMKSNLAKSDTAVIELLRTLGAELFTKNFLALNSLNLWFTLKQCDDVKIV